MRNKNLKSLVAASLLVPALVGCNVNSMKQAGSSSSASSSVDGQATSSGGGSSSPAPIVAGAGATVPGTGALTVPTADAVVARITNGLGGAVAPMAGNYAKGLAQVRSNLPKATDATKVSGFDQVQLLAYAACSDLTTGTTPLMQSSYGINPKGTIASNQAALVSAGVKILDRYAAGLASTGPTSAQVSTAFTNLVTTLEGTATNTSTIAFMSVCIAATTSGTLMLGF